MLKLVIFLFPLMACCLGQRQQNKSPILTVSADISIRTPSWWAKRLGDRRIHNETCEEPWTSSPGLTARMTCERTLRMQCLTVPRRYKKNAKGQFRIVPTSPSLPEYSPGAGKWTSGQQNPQMHVCIPWVEPGQECNKYNHCKPGYTCTAESNYIKKGTNIPKSGYCSKEVHKADEVIRPYNQA